MQTWQLCISTAQHSRAEPSPQGCRAGSLLTAASTSCSPAPCIPTATANAPRCYHMHKQEEEGERTRSHTCFRKGKPCIRLLQSSEGQKCRSYLSQPAAQQGRAAVQHCSSTGQQGSNAGQRCKAVMQSSSTAGQQCSMAGQQCNAAQSCSSATTPLHSPSKLQQLQLTTAICLHVSFFFPFEVHLLSLALHSPPMQFAACIPPVCSLPSVKWKVQFFRGYNAELIQTPCMEKRK